MHPAPETRKAVTLNALHTAVAVPEETQRIEISLPERRTNTHDDVHDDVAATGAAPAACVLKKTLERAHPRRVTPPLSLLEDDDTNLSSSAQPIHCHEDHHEQASF